MSASLLLNILAVLAFIPASLTPYRQIAARDRTFWVATMAVIILVAAFSGHLMSGAWQTNLGTAIWVSISVTVLIFALISIGSERAWRLSPLLMPYLMVLGILASFVRGQPQPMIGGASKLWLDLHILISVLTYSMLTLAAVASLGVFLQERALKRKQPNRLTRMLPAVVEGETLAGRLLAASQVILGVGLITGMVTQYFEVGTLFTPSHKTLLSILAFVLIGALLIGHRVCGVRGRLAARIVLVAYLVLTFAYLGVKFVTQVIL